MTRGETFGKVTRGVKSWVSPRAIAKRLEKVREILEPILLQYCGRKNPAICGAFTLQFAAYCNIIATKSQQF